MIFPIINKIESVTKMNLHLIFIVILIIKSFLFNIYINDNPLGHLTYFITIPGIVMILVAPTFLIPTKIQFKTLLILNFLISSLLIFDIWYIRYFDRPLSVLLIKQMANIFWTVPSIKEVSKYYDWLFFADIPILILIKNKIKTKLRVDLRFGIILAVVGLLFVSTKPLKELKTHGTIISQWSDKNQLIESNVLVYHSLDIVLKVCKLKAYTLKYSDRQFIKTWYNTKKQVIKQTTPKIPFGIATGYNVLVIQIESLGNFAIHGAIHGKPIAPALSKMANEGIYFSNHYDQNMDGGTSDAEFSLLTSLYPSKKGSVFFLNAQNKFNSFPLLLKKNGYTTLAFHNNSGSFWNRDIAYKNLGIDYFYDKAKMAQLMKNKNTTDNGSLDKELFENAAAVLKSTRQPFFSLLITIETHLGYYQNGLSNYFKSITALDLYIQDFIDTLRNNGILEKTVVVIYGDHTPYLNVQPSMLDDMCYSGPGFRKDNTPLIIWCPQKIVPERFNECSGQIDIFPSLLHLIGVYSPGLDTILMGRNLFATNNSYVQIRPDILKTSNEDTSSALHWLTENAFDVSDILIKSNYFAK